MESDLYQWYPVSHGYDLPRQDWMVLAGRTSADGDVYVGRNEQHEAGEITQKDHVMKNIRCHAHGKADDGYALVLRPNSCVQWKAFKSNDSLPPGAVCSGETKKDGKVYVARDHQHRVGKLTVDGSRIKNLWNPWGDNLRSMNNLLCPLKEGEILIVSPGEQVFDLRWDPVAQCGEYKASARVTHLQQHESLSDDLAKWMVMSEYQKEFAQNTVCETSETTQIKWNPDAMCDGHTADARSRWLQKDREISEAEAQQEVMKEFPDSFAQNRGCKRSELPAESRAGWNPDAVCDGHTADARSRWLQKEKKISKAEAQEKVMNEFPHSFELPSESQARWNPDAMCDGLTADSRSRWLQEEKGLSEADAQKKVMREFQGTFAKITTQVNVSALWKAQLQENGERPSQPQLTWNPNAHCGGRMADARVRCLQKEEDMSETLAQQKVMNEFPASFATSESKIGEERSQQEQQSEFLKVFLAIVGAISAMCYLFADDLFEIARKYTLAAGLIIFVLSLILMKALEYYPKEGRMIIGFALRLCGQEGVLGDSQQELQILKNEFQRAAAAAIVSVLAMCYFKREDLLSLARAHLVATGLILVVIGRLLFKVFETIPEESKTAMEAAEKFLSASS